MRTKPPTFRYLHFVLQHLVSGYHGWGLLRLCLMTAFGVGSSMIWGAVLERESLMASVVALKTNLPLLEGVPNPLLILLLTPFRWNSLRYLIITGFTFFLALLLGARYIQDIYNIPTLEPSFRYLIACLFGLGYPTRKVGFPEQGASNNPSGYLAELGGPGTLQLAAGYAAVISSPQTTSNIYGEGIHFLLRGEKVEEIIDLSDQSDTLELISAFSHEGVAIRISDVHFGYRIKQSPPLERSLSAETKSMAVSVNSIRNLMQSRVVTEQGLTEWRTMVKGLVRTVIVDFIYRHSVTELLKPPTDYNPYVDLKKTFQSRPIRERLRKMGTELLWINAGLFDLEKETTKQAVLLTWQMLSSSPSKLPSNLSTQDCNDEQRQRLQAKLLEELLSQWEQYSPQTETAEKIRLLLEGLSPSSTGNQNP